MRPALSWNATHAVVVSRQMITRGFIGRNGRQYDTRNLLGDMGALGPRFLQRLRSWNPPMIPAA